MDRPTPFEQTTDQLARGRQFRASLDLIRWSIQALGPIVLLFVLFIVGPIYAAITALVLIGLSLLYSPNMTFFDANPRLKRFMSNFIAATTFAMHLVTTSCAFLVLAMGLGVNRDWIGAVMLSGFFVYPLVALGIHTPLRQMFCWSLDEIDDRRTMSCTEGRHETFRNGNQVGRPR